MWLYPLRPDELTGGKPKMVQRLHRLLKTRQYERFREELRQSEAAGELPEFYVLDFQAIVAMIEGTDLVNDYLEMAEAVAASPHEVAIVAEHRAAYGLLRGDPHSAVERCLATLDHDDRSGGLWTNLPVTPGHLGEVETIDAALQRFAPLDEECASRLLRLLSSEPELWEVHARPASRDLLEGQVTGTPPDRLIASLDTPTCLPHGAVVCSSQSCPDHHAIDNWRSSSGTLTS
jgi:hypothetical protein